MFFNRKTAPNPDVTELSALPDPGRSNGTFRLRLLGFALLLISILGLARGYGYFGRILSGWDAQYYYAAARAFVFGPTADITPFLKESPWTEPFDKDGDGDFEMPPKNAAGDFISKYPVGLSLITAGFLAASHPLRLGLEALGFTFRGPPGLSELEIFLVALGLIFIIVYSLVLLAGLCRDLFPQGDWAWAVGASFLGTTLYYYTAVFPFNAHGLSFALSLFWTINLKGLTEGHEINRRYFLLGILAGMIFLVRPQQVLLPLLSLPWLLWPLRKNGRAALPGVMAGGLAALLAVGATLIWNHAQSGAFTLNGYSAEDEGFDFLNLHFGYILVGLERGLFIYTPLVLLSLPGLVRLARRRDASWTFPLMANALAQVVLVAAWWCPNQGDAFGMRMWTENSVVAALGLAGSPASGIFGNVRLRRALWFVCSLWTLFLMRSYIIAGWAAFPLAW